MFARAAGLLLLLFLSTLPWRAAEATGVAPTTSQVENPLAPADTSSPRATLNDFVSNIGKAAKAWETNAPWQTVKHYGDLAFRAFDFSQLPRENRLVRELESVLYLKEILDRIDLPPAESIPGEAEVNDEAKPITRWSIPQTSITIAKMTDGPRAGEFLFTADTVEQLQDLYQSAKHLPYKPGAAERILERFLHSPGVLVPHAVNMALPQWSRTLVFGEAIWQWLALVLILTGAWLLIRLLLHCGRQWDKHHRGTAAGKRFGTPIALFASVVILGGARVILVYGAKLQEGFWDVLSSLIMVLIFIGLSWFVVLVTGRIADAINEARKVKEGSIDSQLARVVLRLVGLLLLVCLVLYAAGYFGVPLTPVVASLGVGGLAIALAVRPTLENIIGGLTLFADKPVRIGDYCRFGNEEGTVEAIGLRSTRVRKQDDTLVSLPNADFSQREIVSYAQCRQRLYRTTLGLRYETTAEQLRFVIARLREMLLGHPMVAPQKLHVRFHAFGAYSLDVEIFAYIKTAVWLEYRAVREDINFRIIDIVSEAGTGFAFPSQTAYLGRDSGLDAARGQQAEAAVKAWRTKGQLPFPEFDPALQWEKEDVLDYPPQGSPGFTPRAGMPAAAPPETVETPPNETAAAEPAWRHLLRRIGGEGSGRTGEKLK